MARLRLPFRKTNYLSIRIPFQQALALGGWLFALAITVVIFVPPLHAVFKTGFLTLRQWGVVLPFSFIPMFLIEMTKVIVQRWKKGRKGGKDKVEPDMYGLNV